MDLITAPHSAFSYEDLPTDRFGAAFGAYYFNPESNQTLAQQMAGFFADKLKPTLPQYAPNFNSLPPFDDGTAAGLINKTAVPVFTGGKPPASGKAN